MFAFHYEHPREYLTYSGGENRGRGILKPKESSQQNTAEAYNIPLDVPNLIRKGEILLFFPCEYKEVESSLVNSLFLKLDHIVPHRKQRIESKK